MDYKGLKICKILEPTFMEDNKVFKVNDVCLGYETNNNNCYCIRRLCRKYLS